MFVNGLLLSATAARHVCHGGVARLPCRRGTFATAAWQTVWRHVRMRPFVAKTVLCRAAMEGRRGGLLRFVARGAGAQKTPHAQAVERGHAGWSGEAAAGGRPCIEG